MSKGSYPQFAGSAIQLLMQEKLIVTLWKAQLRDFPKQDQVYCRLTYNGQERNSKPTSQSNNLAWKETFVFPLSKQQLPLHMDFIELPQNQEVHFAGAHIAETLSFGRASVAIEVDGSHHGSLPCKVDITDKNGSAVGKIFIEYEVMKTEVTYTVDKQLDYYYLLKLTSFRVNFVRNLKHTPRFYLRCHTEGRTHKEDLPFQQDEAGGFVYNYPVKLYLKKELEMELELFVGEGGEVMRQTESSFSESIMTEKKTNKSSIGKKEKILLELGKDKISAMMDLTFKKDTKVNRKLPLFTMVKFQRREIGNIEFQAQAFFRSKEELHELQEQKKGLNPELQPKSLQRKKSLIKQTNGIIVINSILGKLELFNDTVIEGRDISIEVKLGKQAQESTVLEKPGKELIFIDTFQFRRTWEETMKVTIQLHSGNQKIPTFFAEVNLRELFELGRYVSKKVKLKDENKNYSGELVLDMIYKEQEERKSPLSNSMASISEMPDEDPQEAKIRLKRQQIQLRLKKRSQEKARSRELNSMSTMAVLQQNDIILPPLKSSSRMQTLSPKRERTRAANLFNINGVIKFSKSPRFESNEKPGYESYTYVRDSEFDSKHKKGTYIGYGNKMDFTKPVALNPGVGRYEIPSVWDKYK